MKVKDFFNIKNEKDLVASILFVASSMMLIISFFYYSYLGIDKLIVMMERYTDYLGSVYFVRDLFEFITGYLLFTIVVLLMFDKTKAILIVMILTIALGFTGPMVNVFERGFVSILPANKMFISTYIIISILFILSYILYFSNKSTFSVLCSLIAIAIISYSYNEYKFFLMIRSYRDPYTHRIDLMYLLYAFIFATPIYKIWVKTYKKYENEQLEKESDES